MKDLDSLQKDIGVEKPSVPVKGYTFACIAQCLALSFVLPRPIADRLSGWPVN